MTRKNLELGEAEECVSCGSQTSTKDHWENKMPGEIPPGENQGLEWGQGVGIEQSGRPEGQASQGPAGYVHDGLRGRECLKHRHQSMQTPSLRLL